MNGKEDIKAYLDGELTPEQAAVVERLLADDPEAATEADSFRKIADSVRALAASAQPVGLDAAVNRIARPRRILWPALSACAAVVLLGLVGPRVVGGLALFRTDANQTSMASVGDSRASAGAVPGELAFESAPPERAKSETAPTTSVAGSEFEDKSVDARSNLGELVSPPVVSQPPPVLQGTREVIRNADLGVKVKDAATALAELLRSTEALGGYFENSTLQVNQEKPVATARLRVPSVRFEAAVSMIRGLGTVERESVSGEDVTAQVVDYGARARVLANEEQALIAMLRNTRNVSALIEIRQRLATVRAELESYNSMLKELKNLSSLSTITVELTQDLGAGDGLAPGDWLGKTTAVAVHVLAEVGKVVVQGVVFLLVLTPVWLPVALVARWYLRRHPRP